MNFKSSGKQGSKFGEFSTDSLEKSTNLQGSVVHKNNSSGVVKKYCLTNSCIRLNYYYLLSFWHAIIRK